MNEGQDRTVIQSFIRRASRLMSTTTRAFLFFSVKCTSGTPRYSSSLESDERAVVIAIERYGVYVSGSLGSSELSATLKRLRAGLTSLYSPSHSDKLALNSLPNALSNPVSDAMAA